MSDPAPAVNASDFVTQSELAAQLNALTDSLSAKFGQPATTTPPQNVAADGNGENPFAAANAINNLSGVTITNANLTASEIPALNYFPSTSTISVAYGGTGVSSFGQGWIYSNGGGGTLAASTSPTVNYITATSSTATSSSAHRAAFPAAASW